MSSLSELLDFVSHGHGLMMLLVAVTVSVCAVGYYVVDKVRRSLREEGPSVHEHVTNFRELHARGQLSDEEYRNIKSKLASRLVEQVKTNKPDS